MNEVLELFFARGEELGIDDFDGFCENFINERDESLSGAFLSIYKKLLSLPEGVNILGEKANALSNVEEDNFLESQWGMVIGKRIYSLLCHYERIYSSALEYFAGDEVLEYNYTPGFTADLELIRRAIEGRHTLTYDGLRKMLSEHTFITLGRKKVPADLKTPELEFYKSVRNKFKDDHSSICKKTLLAMPAEKIPLLCRLSEKAIRDLQTFLTYFEQRLQHRKLVMGVLTFADCERYAMKLLADSDGNPTDVAIEYRERFREIYIDEYQDTNRLQDTIFRLIARPGGRFMVGDIKQSIYAFRAADPTLFADYRDKWQPYADGDITSANSVYLSANFRSGPKIINTVNSVFSPLFNCAGNINYREEDELLSPKADLPCSFDNVKIAVVSNEIIECDDSGTIETNDKNQLRCDAEYLASEVSRLIVRGEKLSDIAVLVRNRSSMHHVEAALKEFHIPYESASDAEFFTLPEIQLVLSILHVIDNPTREIHLIAVLTSPLYSLTPDELAFLRIENSRELSLYDIIMSSQMPKLLRFRDDLDIWREKARRLPTDKLIRWLYNEYGIINVACSGTGNVSRMLVRMNCEKLYDLARVYESTSYKGIYNFLEHIAILSRSNSGVSAPELASENCVRIMTIHNSKGLEFKNCFIFDASNSLKKKGKGDDILFSKTLGFGMFVREKDSPYRYDTPFRAAIACDNEDKQIEEELRILYVAMTRAKERLWIIGNASKPWEVIQRAELSARFLDEQTVYSDQNYLSWIITALSLKGDTGDWTISEECGVFEGCFSEKSKKDTSFTTTKGEYLDKLRKRFDFEYPSKALTRIPAKLSVSRLYPGVLDEADPSADLDGRDMPVLRRPLFAGGGIDNRAANVGTATHLFMQFCDFDILFEKGSEYELARLRNEMFLSSDVADMVSLTAINGFISSKLFREILSSPQIWRERRFNVLLPASDLAENFEEKVKLSDESILVQGVIDCVYTAPDKSLILVDYKTDSTVGMSSEEAVIMFRRRHSLQLGYYKKAIEKLTGRKVSKTLIYSFGISDTVELK